MIPLISIGLLFTPQFAFAASPGLVTSAGPLSKFVLLNQNILQGFVNGSNFGLGLLAYAAIVKTVTYYPVEWLTYKIYKLLDDAKNPKLN